MFMVSVLRTLCPLLRWGVLERGSRLLVDDRPRDFGPNGLEALLQSLYLLHQVSLDILSVFEQADVLFGPQFIEFARFQNNAGVTTAKSIPPIVAWSSARSEEVFNFSMLFNIITDGKDMCARYM